ncbi:MAG: sigma-E processing peptidase SpoIIGA [Firmicutes bacterium]|nr:sigma-E processing peptidase SpoIIGA [Bacillota bacterium]
MVVYIEVVIIDNFFITLLISILSYRALSVKISYYRAFLASIIGTAVAVIFPFLNWHFGFLLSLRIALLLSLTFILFFKKAKLLSSSLIFLAVSFIFGGALFAVGLNIHGSVENALTLPVSNIPVGLVILFALIMYVILRKLLSKIKRTFFTKDLILKTNFSIFNKEFSVLGFVDTGNMLWCNRFDLPVVILSSSLSLEILGDRGLSALLRDKLSEIHPKAYYINSNSVGNKKSKILVLPLEKFMFYNQNIPHRIEGVALGLSIGSSGKFFGNCDIILHKAIFENINLRSKTKTTTKTEVQGVT